MHEEGGDNVALWAAATPAERGRGEDASTLFDHAGAFAEERGRAFGGQPGNADRVRRAVVQAEAASHEGHAQRFVTRASERAQHRFGERGHTPLLLTHRARKPAGAPGRAEAERAYEIDEG